MSDVSAALAKFCATASDLANFTSNLTSYLRQHAIKLAIPRYLDITLHTFLKPSEIIWETSFAC